MDLGANKKQSLKTGEFRIKYNKIHSTNQGFSLAEVIIVVIIMAVLASLAIPRFFFILEKVKVGEAVGFLQAIREAQFVYRFENGSFATDFDDLDLERPPFTKYFLAPTVDDGEFIAGIGRSTLEYRLFTREDGTIVCASNSCGGDPLGYLDWDDFFVSTAYACDVANPAGVEICARLGFETRPL